MRRVSDDVLLHVSGYRYIGRCLVPRVDIYETADAVVLKVCAPAWIPADGLRFPRTIDLSR